MKKCFAVVFLFLLATCFADPVTISSAAYEASHIIKAGAGASIVTITGYSSNASAQFIQLHDSATVPANGVAPLAVFTVAATGNFSYVSPLKYANGLVVCNSTTGPTKTLGATDCYFTITIQ
jgi:hypothetical protein